jgi:ribosome maturation factor RimP
VITVDDCEIVTRQLQHVLEVEGADYARLEVSSPGLDRPLKRAEHYLRFLGEQIDLTLKMPFQGRKKYRGLLQAAQGSAPEASPQVGAVGADDGAATLAVEPGFELVFNDGQADQVLGFVLSEVREAKLVPVLDFKGRNRSKDGEAVGGKQPWAPGRKRAGRKKDAAGVETPAMKESNQAEESGGHEE